MDHLPQEEVEEEEAEARLPQDLQEVSRWQEDHNISCQLVRRHMARMEDSKDKHRKPSLEIGKRPRIGCTNSPSSVL